MSDYTISIIQHSPKLWEARLNGTPMSANGECASEAVGELSKVMAEAEPEDDDEDY